jgi:hypothetical protein
MRSLFGMLGEMLYAEGHFAAARAHFVLFEGFSSPETRRNEPDLLQRFQTSRDISPLYKRGMYLLAPSPNADWREEYLAAIELTRKAHWAKALERLVALAQRFPDQYEIMHGIASICGWLGNDELAIAAWRRLSELPGIDHEGAVEAEAMAQLLEGFLDADSVEALEVTVEIDDLNNTLERLNSLPQARSIPVSAHEADDGPPPRATFLIGDHLLQPGSEGDPKDVPNLLTIISVFGKETDRPSRAMFQLIRDASYPEQITALKAALGAVSNQVEAPIGNIGFVSNLLRQRPFPAAKIEVANKDSFLLKDYPWRQIRTQVLPHASSLLHGLTLAQAAQDPALRRRAEAYLLNLSLYMDNYSWEISLNDLRREVGLEPLPLLSEEAIRGNIDLFRNYARLPRFDMEHCSDTLLSDSLNLATSLGLGATAYRCATVTLSRPSLADHQASTLAHQLAAGRCEDDQQYKLHVFRAADGMAKQDTSPAQLLIATMIQAWQKGFSTSFSAILERLQRQHGRERGVMEMLYRILVEIGAVAPHAGTTPPAAAATDAVAGIAAADSPAAAGIWTPESATAEPAAGKSKLWLPGME